MYQYLSIIIVIIYNYAKALYNFATIYYHKLDLRLYYVFIMSLLSNIENMRLFRMKISEEYIEQEFFDYFLNNINIYL